LAGGWNGTGLTATPSRTFWNPFGHHLLARRYPVLDHPHRADARSDLDRADLYLVVLVHDRNLVGPLQLGDRALRHHSAPCFTAMVARTRPNCPGRRMFAGLGNAAAIRIVPVAGSTWRSASTNCRGGVDGAIVEEQIERRVAVGDGARLRGALRPPTN